MCAGEGESDWHVLTVTTGGDADFRQVRAASQIGGGVWVVAVALVGAVLGVMADAGDTAHGRVDESIDAVLDHGLFDSVGECRHLLVDNRLDFVALKLAGALHVRLVAFDSSRIDRSIRVSQVLEAVALPDGGLTDTPDTGVGHEVHRPAFSICMCNSLTRHYRRGISTECAGSLPGRTHVHLHYLMHLVYPSHCSPVRRT